MDEQEKRERHKEYKERFIRWQQLSIKQLSYINNLFLGLNLAFLGFFTTKIELKFSCSCWLFTIQVISLSLLGTSFIFGILTVYNRLKDFRATHQLVKNKKSRFEYRQKIVENLNISQIETNIKRYQKITDELGYKTWNFLRWQIWTFAIGVGLGILFILIKEL